MLFARLDVVPVLRRYQRARNCRHGQTVFNGDPLEKLEVRGVERSPHPMSSVQVGEGHQRCVGLGTVLAHKRTGAGQPACSNHRPPVGGGGGACAGGRCPDGMALASRVAAYRRLW